MARIQTCTDALKLLIENGRRCIWFKVPSRLSHLISVLIKVSILIHTVNEMLIIHLFCLSKAWF